jgi:RHS repeat-associated protein
MEMPGRVYSAGTGYRYGFNGKEIDKDINSLTAYDYGFRIYNPTIGKFLSVDPLQKQYPELTPYQFASNSPIQGVDLDGREIFHYTITSNSQGQAVLQLTKTEELTGRGNKGIKRYIVTYEDFECNIKWDGDKVKDITYSQKVKTYHIGFPQYGVGYANAWKNEDFERDYIKKSGEYINFGFEYVDDDHSQAASDVSIVVNTQNVASEHAISMLGASETPTGTTNKTVASANSGNTGAAIANTEAAETLLTQKARVFSSGGSIGMMDNAMELNVNVNTKRLTASLILDDKTVFFEGTVSTENNILTIKNIGIRNQAGNYNNTDLVNMIGPGKFKNLIDQLKVLRVKGGYTSGTLEYERMKPEGSTLKDREQTSISL